VEIRYVFFGMLVGGSTEHTGPPAGRKFGLAVLIYKSSTSTPVIFSPVNLTSFDKNNKNESYRTAGRRRHGGDFARGATGDNSMPKGKQEADARSFRFGSFLQDINIALSRDDANVGTELSASRGSVVIC
jgi:hypothetical protein